ncbi:MAG TPA: hypothetical protein PKD55_02425 [Bellilinea sp.]|nr:hypothetical protein [Bellilinea sp.]
MANGRYSRGRQAFGDGEVNWTADDIRVVLVDTGLYTVDLALHDFLDDIPAGARVATLSASLGGKSNSGGVLDANDATFPLVSGSTAEALVVYRHTGTEATSVLLFYIDTATGLPVTPNGDDVVISWDNGANRIIRI